MTSLDAVRPEKLQGFKPVSGAVHMPRLLRELAEHRLQPVTDMLLIVHHQNIDHAYQPPRFSFSQGSLRVTQVYSLERC